MLVLGIHSRYPGEANIRGVIEVKVDKVEAKAEVQQRHNSLTLSMINASIAEISTSSGRAARASIKTAS
jgi:hypothetical protein